MQIFFDKATLQFLVPGIHKIPEGAVPVSHGEYSEALSSLAEGGTLVVCEEGPSAFTVQPADPAKPPLFSASNAAAILSQVASNKVGYLSRGSVEARVLSGGPFSKHAAAALIWMDELLETLALGLEMDSLLEGLTEEDVAQDILNLNPPPEGLDPLIEGVLL